MSAVSWHAFEKNKMLISFPEVEYLGHRISRRGLHPTDKKIQANTNAPEPQNVTQLKAFLGMVNYYGKSFSDLLTTLVPLYHFMQQ